MINVVMNFEELRDLASPAGKIKNRMLFIYNEIRWEPRKEFLKNVLKLRGVRVGIVVTMLIETLNSPFGIFFSETLHPILHRMSE
jgi:hypothetical protein